MGLYAPDEVEASFNSAPPVVPFSPSSPKVTASFSGTIGQLNALVEERDTEPEQAEIFDPVGVR